MSELPDLLSETIGDAAIIDTVDVGGGDAITVTPERTHLYRSEGLLRDESVETFEHAVERLSVRTKRRKSSIELVTMESQTSFTVPSDVADSVVEAMMEGILLTTGAVTPEEELSALFRFSELTVVVTDRRLFEHVGSAVWDGEFETVEYAELTGLDFERGSVATQVVLETEDRRRRVKVPNEHAGTVRQRIEAAVLAFHDVASIEAFRAKHAEPEQGDGRANRSAAAIGDAERTEANGADAEGDRDPTDGRSAVSTSRSLPADQDPSGAVYRRDAETDAAREDPKTQSTADDRGTNPTDEIDALSERVEALSEQVERQTELIETQQDLLERLVDELRRGR
ncbi:uncharacterized protein Nmlp_2036 [Natronomonas moolapensis 8.8.11]|uniref:DUF7115 domain-containing protein n=1 Tax=Natronomonas moolapensis (strain DSM 18674 / CECT 7526 / JCM 14361 / 8.8.11) TaxID=268739 RepID=M1XKN3_NATM8|nr:hypothetical protein [Natronomonas moolapensis]CCQ36208.1 uncharacterized protein Nmlp_2024 [Natronomonas moolapensis 8.8.11]CCQ36220.1 uncharacterized protein Nmlp_2036 [Natronomonas moolapensis 8.8.11]